MPASMDRLQVLAFRLARHNLARRLEPEALLQAAGACAIQNTPPGGAELALHARLSGLAPGCLDRRLLEDKTLLQAWSLRGAPHIFPTNDRAVFTLGLLPQAERDLRAFMLGAQSGLDTAGISAVDLVERVSAALAGLLAGRAMTKDEMGVEVAARLDADLSAAQQAVWRSPSPVARGQSWGESLVRFALPVAAFRGVCCHAERRGDQAYLRRLEDWLPSASVAAIGDGGPAGRSGINDPGYRSPGGPPAELLRRYLRCYAPSTAQNFAVWAGISPAQAGRTWTALLPELAEVAFAGRPAWLLAADLPALLSPPEPSGARFLPAHDPYLQSRDRLTLLPNKSLHARLWRTAGSPGALLVDSELAGIWRSHKRSTRLELEIEPFAPLSPAQRADIEAEAASLAELKTYPRIFTNYHE